MTTPEAQFEALYRTAGTRVLGFLIRRCDSSEDAAEMFGEVLMVAWKRRDDLPSPPDDTLWLFGVARLVLLADRRLSTRRTQVVNELARHLSLLGHEPDHAGVVALTQTLASLPEMDREVLTLSVWEGLNAVEIGEVLAIPAVSVRSRLHRARARLRTQLATDPSRSR